MRASSQPTRLTGPSCASAAGRSAVTRTRLLWRVHQLRESVTSYDATYLALAEAIEAPLVTCDGPLARAHGHGATIEHHPI